MQRRVFWLGLLVLAVLLSGPLTSALGVAPSAVQLTATATPAADPAYLPLVIKAGAPPATSTTTATTTALPTASATATTPAASATASATATVLGGHSLTVSLTEQLQWHQTTPGTNYDLVIVADYSASMKNCWDSTAACPAGSRRIDYAAAVLRDFVNEMLVVRNSGANGGDNRLAYVTFGQTATKVIPFGPTEETLASFKAAIGDKASPKTLPNSVLTGNTNTSAGLASAVSYINGARSVDKNGNPVRLAVLLLTDGVPNVFNDGPAAGITNHHSNAPYYCGEGDSDLDNPLVQANCPSQADYPGQLISNPPIQSMIKLTDDARNTKPIVFYSALMGAQFGLTPVDMHMHEVAPGNYFMANTPAQLAGLIQAIAVELGLPCYELATGGNPAPGASLTIKEQDGDLFGTYAADAQGQVVVPALPPGDYALTAQHLGVIAPADPSQIARNYTRMIVAGGDPAPLASTTFTMPAADLAFPAIKLVINNDVNAKCP